MSVRKEIRWKYRIVPSVSFVARSIPGFQPRFLIDPRHMQQLEELYRGRLTENTQLTKVARLAAEE